MSVAHTENICDDAIPSAAFNVSVHDILQEHCNNKNTCSDDALGYCSTLYLVNLVRCILGKVEFAKKVLKFRSKLERYGNKRKVCVVKNRSSRKG
jgi:hypothetical protein